MQGADIDGSHEALKIVKEVVERPRGVADRVRHIACGECSDALFPHQCSALFYRELAEL